ncbi:MULTISPECIES: hypothetical protein [Propionibacterium]|uniref:hypothetical protein n=1 Tax=Propionibacterium TaxID=1743 RepID=UPI0005A5CFB9|nr:hypothetical protein [Propionibacterium freudenreichii]CEI28684.1 Hypothetical membrane protein [Propionibacterium freudenreichii]SBN59681.1 Efflux ABC transporter, permease protein [Propionibacterium freudenreichii]SBN95138.1 Efflux ABC transporter, permease protein [Propionibacterium freudenreichii]SCC96724.1 Efflux ABC transporter, permease protein [Propionibacterium freudenreichii]SCQ48121.1 Efflux ABC transporter, permease protein [Propionibacterium freudenreichii]
MRPQSLVRVAALVTRPGRGGSARDARGVLTVLSVVAYTVVQALALSVAAGVMVFVDHDRHPSNRFQADNSGIYVLLAMLAGAVLIAPLVVLCAAAARMGALRRARRLSIVRLLGGSPAEVRTIGVIEAFGHALVGVVGGTVVYLATLPLWSPLHFEGQALSAAAMWIGPLGLGLVSLAVLVIATASAVIGLQRVAISPLGVVRRTAAPGLKKARLIVPLVIVVGWAVAGQLISDTGFVVVVGSIVLALAALLAGVDFVGPLLVQWLGNAMASRANSAASLIAGRRIADAPKATWRAVGALSMASFLASFTAMLPLFGNGSDSDQDMVVLLGDMRQGVLLTLSIAFLLTAVSSGLNQAAKILDRIGDARTLSVAGAPRGLLTAIRRREVLVPVVVATVMPALAGLAFQFPFTGPLITQRPDMLITLLATLVAGIGLVFAVQECCSPLQTRLLCEQQRSTD